MTSTATNQIIRLRAVVKEKNGRTSFHPEIRNFRMVDVRALPWRNVTPSRRSSPTPLATLVDAHKWNALELPLVVGPRVW